MFQFILFFFSIKEGDLFSAEIQQIYQDGGLALQTRNLRYGKLGEGILVHVRSSLVKRTKNHFHSLPCGALIIRGCNGAIWICPPTSDHHIVDTGGYVKNIESVNLDVRKTIVRLSNCIQILNRLGLPIYDTSIMQMYDLSINYEIDELIEPKVIQTLSKNLHQQKEILNGGNGLDPYSRDMQEE
jgi:exosome complex component RRP4